MVISANTRDVVSEEDLKHFHTSLLGNEEDAKGLLNNQAGIFIAPYSAKWFH